MKMERDLKIIKQTKSMGDLVIRPVEKTTAKAMIIKHHYSRKWNQASFGKYNFGIFKAGHEQESECLGVAVYGFMKNPKAKIFKHPNPKGWMCELNRMWIDDLLGHNAETILIGASLKLLKRLDPTIVAVQSFADGRLGCGTIYKAANFQYYGYHFTKFLENTRTGEMIHGQIFTDSSSTSGYLRNNIIYLIGETKTYEVKTYRYIYPLCKKFVFTLKERKPYPKYEKGMHEINWKRNHTLIADRMVKMIYKLVE